MKFDLQYDILDCITELNRIAEELKAAALDIQRSIVGIDTQKTVKGLNDAADKYKRAAENLRKIR